MMAFDLALDLGADALEFDVRLTSDGVPVVHHDRTLFRTAGVAAPVGSLTAATLAGVDAGSRFTSDDGHTFPFRGRGVQVPTLAAVLERFRDIPLLIEIKDRRAAEPARWAIDDAGAADHVVVAAFDSACVAPFRDAPYLCGGATGDVAGLYFPAALGMRTGSPLAVRALSVPVRWRGIPVPTRRFVRAANTAGVPVHVWTVDTAKLARSLWARGVSGIVTNVPDVILDARPGGVLARSR